MNRRHELSDEQWVQVAPSLPRRDGDPERSGEDNRWLGNVVVWIVKTGGRDVMCPGDRESQTNWPPAQEGTA